MSARVLVVDDVPTNIKLLQIKLEAEYFEVLTADDGATALRLAAEEAPDIILLDVMMPEMDGFEVCRRLRQDPKTQHIPVVMVTALSDVENRVKGLEAGADDFLSKPLNDVALFARVRSLTRLKVMMDELRVRQAASGQSEVSQEEAFGTEAEVADASILLVENCGGTAEQLAGSLSKAQHSVEQATTASEALSASASGRHDLIIVSLHLGEEDGLRLCSQIRSQDATRHTPILLILAEGDLSRLAKGLDLGVNDYLIEPIDGAELRARTRTQIRRRRYHERLKDVLEQSVAMAYTDSLTGIYNRRYMNAHLDRKIMAIAENAKPVSVLLFDIDHFKRVNDGFGHAVGDAILKEMAQRVTGSLRESDMVARYGGEEFVVVLPDTTAEEATVVAERLRRSIGDRPFTMDGQEQPLSTTISIGVATTQDPMEEATLLLSRADAALYQAKDSGRNCVISADLDPPARERALARA